MVKRTVRPAWSLTTDTESSRRAGSLLRDQRIGGRRPRRESARALPTHNDAAVVGQETTHNTIRHARIPHGRKNVANALRYRGGGSRDHHNFLARRGKRDFARFIAFVSPSKPVRYTEDPSGSGPGFNSLGSRGGLRMKGKTQAPTMMKPTPIRASVRCVRNMLTSTVLMMQM